MSKKHQLLDGATSLLWELLSRKAHRECCWARNTPLTISSHTPVELTTGRRPTDHSDLELMKPDQLSAADLPRDATLQELKKLALRAHLEARQSADLRRDLARRVFLLVGLMLMETSVFREFKSDLGAVSAFMLNKALVD